MNISIISPHTSQNGNTTLAGLIALELSQKGRKVCLSSVTLSSKALYEYFNLTSFEDKTSTANQLVRLIKEDALEAQDFSDYCKRVTDEMEIFSTNDNIDEEDTKFLLDYMVKNLPHDYTIFDIDEDALASEKCRIIIESTDLVILNLTQSVTELEKFKKQREETMAKFGKKPAMVVVNKFNGVQGTIKEAAKAMGIKKPNNWLTLRYNPWIGWGTNHKNLLQVFVKMKNLDIRVKDIESDLNKIGNAIVRAKTKIRGKAGANK